jgi:hypothetical protein
MSRIVCVAKSYCVLSDDRALVILLECIDYHWHVSEVSIVSDRLLFIWRIRPFPFLMVLLVLTCIMERILMPTCLDVAMHLHANEQFERTALMWAAKNGHTECARLLVEAGADIAVMDCVRIINSHER